MSTTIELIPDPEQGGYTARLGSMTLLHVSTRRKCASLTGISQNLPVAKLLRDIGMTPTEFAALLGS